MTAVLRRAGRAARVSERLSWRPRRARLRLRRADGLVYLERWGLESDRIGGIFLHRMDAPDPGVDLHDHPWAFVSIVLAGGYSEDRAPIREVARLAHRARIENAQRQAAVPGAFRKPVGVLSDRRRWSVRLLRLDECHRVTSLHRTRLDVATRCWTLVLHGPRRGTWGFYRPASGWMHYEEYDRTVRGSDHRDLWNDVG